MRDVMDRVLAKVTVAETGCWIFGGALTANGYGSIGLGSRADGTGYTHRVTYQRVVGPVPDGLELDHLCRVRACCNPEHLEPVTRRENLLRAEGETAANAAKTHCLRGHKFTAENTRHDGRGRQCRACDVIRRTEEGKA